MGRPGYKPYMEGPSSSSFLVLFIAFLSGIWIKGGAKNGGA